MGRVLLLSGDLLFGSRVQGDLAAAGNEVELVADEQRLRARLGDRSAPPAQALIADLTDERLDGAGIVEALVAEGALPGIHTLAFYSHVDAAVRTRAEGAGFEMVVPRSRMAREGAALIDALMQQPQQG